MVTFDRESCLLYKQELDRHLPPEASDIVMSVNAERTNTRLTGVIATSKKSYSTASVTPKTR